MHLLLFSLLIGIAAGGGLDDKKGPLEDKVLDVPEAAPVPYALYQFHAVNPDVNGFRVSGDSEGKIQISRDGWLYLEEALVWAHAHTHTLQVEALVDTEPVEGPFTVTINVLDINNHAPSFNQTDYVAVIREGSVAGVPFTRVFASDLDDPESTNSHLSYSLVNQIPNKHSTPFFQINTETGEISTTEEGQRLLKAREGVVYSRGQDGSSHDALKRKFDEYCSPIKDVPYELNPFYTCVERAEMRRLNPLEDPDFVLFVRVEDLGGQSENALSSNTRVNVAVQQNLWVTPGPITIKEHLVTTYPMLIAKVQSNTHSALYRLVQKERLLPFPFSVTPEGEVMLTEQMDREEKSRYTVVVLAEDHEGNELDPPMEIQVLVEDVNDNPPVCLLDETVFEIQENELPGSPLGQLQVSDADEENTVNSLLSYTLLIQAPETSSPMFSIDDITGRVQSRQLLKRRDATEYRLTVRVHDPGFSTECKVVIKVIDVNNEVPIFEQSDYGSHTLSEDTPVGHTLLTVKATDADDPGSGSSRIEFHITAGNEDGVFAMETESNGEGRIVLVKPLDFEITPSTRLQIDARNPEPLMAGIQYDNQSTAFVTVEINDVDEAPEFDMDILDVVLPENTSLGASVVTVGAKDPEGKLIEFKLEGDTKSWLEIDPATGEIKTKAKLDREVLEAFDVTVIAFEKANPQLSSECVVSVRLLDVNDNVPKLLETQAFICVKKPKPVILSATDADSAPYSQPFTFTFPQSKKSPNWDISSIDGTSAKLTMKKSPTEDKTFVIPINIKDSAGMGVTHKFEVRVCNCTELGYCYTKPSEHGFKYGIPTTIGILGGTLGFIVLLLVIVFHRIKKDNEKRRLQEGDTQSML
ncbi:cadherin-17 [Osmerus eperlanus]|uniref:cadherin-17 n=1 Tax=Osmerus eperlanus TaxID=29151 RepID=UPI002E136054